MTDTHHARRIRTPDPETLPDEPFRGLFAPAERLIEPFAPRPAERPPSDLLPFIRWSLKGAKGAVVLLAIFTLAFGAAEAAVFFLIGGLVDRAAAAGPGAVFAQEWPWLLVLLFAVVVAKPVTQLGQAALTSLTIGPGLNPMTIWRLHRHTLGQSMRFFEEDFTGRIAQKQQQTAMALTTVVIDTLSALGMLFAYVVAMALLLAAAEPWLGVIVLVWSAGFVAALWWAVPRVRARAMQRAAARAMVTGQLVDSLSHIRTVKAVPPTRTAGRRTGRSAAPFARPFREAGLRPLGPPPSWCMRVVWRVLNPSSSSRYGSAAPCGFLRHRRGHHRRRPQWPPWMKLNKQTY